MIASVREAWALQHSIDEVHNYQSPFWKWPLMLRPIWYEFHSVGNKLTRCVFMLGNPVILLLGLLTLPWQVVRFFTKQNLSSFIIVCFYSCFYFVWGITARESAYHYYYFLPAMFLILSIGDLFGERDMPAISYSILAAAVIAFLYFLPVTSGYPIAASEYLRWWAWFIAWI